MPPTTYNKIRYGGLVVVVVVVDDFNSSLAAQ
jgi:hypothetical protein